MLSDWKPVTWPVRVDTDEQAQKVETHKFERIRAIHDQKAAQSSRIDHNTTYDIVSMAFVTRLNTWR